MTTTYAATASGSTQKNPTGGAERLNATPARPASSVRRSTAQAYGEVVSRLVAGAPHTSTTGFAAAIASGLRSERALASERRGSAMP